MHCGQFLLCRQICTGAPSDCRSGSLTQLLFSPSPTPSDPALTCFVTSATLPSLLAGHNYCGHLQIIEQALRGPCRVCPCGNYGCAISNQGCKCLLTVYKRLPCTTICHRMFCYGMMRHDDQIHMLWLGFQTYVYAYIQAIKSTACCTPQRKGSFQDST